MRVQRAILACTIAVLAFTAVTAQMTGGLKIVVYDAADNTPLPGVSVTLRNTQGFLAPTTVITDRDGVALFPVLRPGGGYVLELFMPGYGKQQDTNLRVKAGEVQTKPYLLGQAITEKVVVVGTRETVDLEKSTTSSKFGKEFIQDLPVQGRFYQNILTMAAGVQDADGDGNPNVHGARDVDFKTQVDGISNQDPLTGQQMNQINPDSVEEVEVITSGASVEYGRAQGGFANVIQKQGSNDFEGQFNMTWRSDLLDGNSNASVPGAPLPKYDTITPGFSLSGPIVKDKLWYFVSHEYIQSDEPRDVLNGIVTVSTKRFVHSDTLTWQVSPRNKLAVKYNADPLTITNFGVSRRVPESSASKLDWGGPTWQLIWTAPFSPKILAESTLAFQKTELTQLPTTTGVANTCATGAFGAGGSLDFPFVATAYCNNLNLNTVSGSYPVTWRDSRERLTAKSSATIYGDRFLGMTHQVKVGFSMESERYFRYLEQRPTITLVRYQDQGDPSDPEATLNSVTLISGQFAVPDSSSGRAVGTSAAFFVEDQVKPLPNLTLTLGLRMDRETISSNGYEPMDPDAERERFHELLNQGMSVTDAMKESFTVPENVSDFEEQLSRTTGIDAGTIGNQFIALVNDLSNYPRARRPSNIDIVNNNFAPRFSLSWDPWSNGKTKVSMSAGRYYDKIFLQVPLTELDPVTTTLRLRSMESFNPETQERTNSVNIGSGINPSATVHTVDRNLKTPYSDQLSVTFERELFAETSMRISYHYRKYYDQLQDIELNHYVADYGTCVRDDLTSRPHGWIDTSVTDGRLDDCDGELVRIETEGGAGALGQLDAEFLHIPDGYLDAYTSNVAWGNIYLVGNYNSAKYKAIELVLQRRMYRNWQMEGSYTWSRAIGDAETFSSLAGDDKANLDDERGYLSYDQRHVVKISATTITPWNFRLGAVVNWQSGLPYSILEQRPTMNTAPLEPESLSGLAPADPIYRLKYPTHKRNDQRNRSYWNFDLKFDREMNLAKGMNLQVFVSMYNLLNDRTYIVYDPDALFGYQLNGENVAYRRPGRQYELGMKLSF